MKSLKEVLNTLYAYDQAGGYVPLELDDDDFKKLTTFMYQQMLEARIDERKQVALDNYHGQTFSDSTNYKDKFDKFIENNERRLETLKQQQSKQGGTEQ